MTDMNGKTLGDVLDGYGGSVFIPTRGVLTPDERADIVCGFLDTPFLSGTLLAADVEKALAVLSEVAYDIVKGGADAHPNELHRILAAAIPGLVVPDASGVLEDYADHGDAAVMGIRVDGMYLHMEDCEGDTVHVVHRKEATDERD